MRSLKLYQSGELERRIRKAYDILAACTLCPRECKVDRVKGKKGFCRAGHLPKVSSFNAHHGEEPPLSGTRGSGTIFLTHCTLKCVYCQNYPISQLDQGEDVSVPELARMMLTLQKRGCHNINFVTPTHFVPQILGALHIAIEAGLDLPLVYNTSGYEKIETLRLLDGLIDIYLPDARYADADTALKYSAAPDYPRVNRRALKEMHRQVGELEVGEAGVAVKGVIVRHLVLPGHLAGSRQTFEFIAGELSPKTYISLMDQYFPAHKAHQYPAVNRRITAAEYREALNAMREAGLERGWRQEHVALWEM